MYLKRPTHYTEAFSDNSLIMIDFWIFNWLSLQFSTNKGYVFQVCASFSFLTIFHSDYNVHCGYDREKIRKGEMALVDNGQTVHPQISANRTVWDNFYFNKKGHIVYNLIYT